MFKIKKKKTMHTTRDKIKNNTVKLFINLYWSKKYVLAKRKLLSNIVYKNLY